MANIVYNPFKKDININVDWVNDTIKAMLVTSAYTPDIDLDLFIDDVTNEVTGTGYTAGGGTLVGKAITIDNTTDVAKYDATDYTWSSSTVTARGVVIYKDTGTPATSPLITYLDFGTDKASSESAFILQWDADGIFKIN